MTVNRMKKKIIGIMTLFFNINYGATLQALALQKVVNGIGYECEDIWYYREINGKSTMTKRIKPYETIKKCVKFFLQLKYIHEKYRIKKGVEERKREFNCFIKKQMKTSKQKYDGHKNIKNALNVYDAFICGSDNIWNTNLLDTAFMLDFVPKDILKISYAAGMSNRNIDPIILDKISGILSKLDYISVREKSGVDIVRKITNKDVIQTLDPTLLLDADEWEKIEEKMEIPYKKYIFCYFFGTNPRAREYADYISKLYELPIITLPYMGGSFIKEDYQFGDLPLFNVGPAQFLWLVRNASYICTDSYHGTIFSILFKKKFWCFRRFFDEKTKSLNYRIDSLLEVLNINNRIIENEPFDRYLDEEIDYLKVGAILNEKRRDSKKYLRDSLNEFSTMKGESLNENSCSHANKTY